MILDREPPAYFPMPHVCSAQSMQPLHSGPCVRTSHGAIFFLLYAQVQANDTMMDTSELSAVQDVRDLCPVLLTA